MTTYERHERIARHPDRHGGSTALMEEFFARRLNQRHAHSLMGERLSSSKHVIKRCACGVRVSAYSLRCSLCVLSHRRQPRKKRVLIGALCLMVASVALAAGPTNAVPLPPQVTMGWDASPTPGVTYMLYGQQRLPAVTNYATIDAGTNLMVGATNLLGGDWSFVVTAREGAIESLPSNVLLFRVPDAPRNLKVIVVKYSLTAVGPWTPAGNLFIEMVP